MTELDFLDLPPEERKGAILAALEYEFRSWLFEASEHMTAAEIRNLMDKEFRHAEPRKVA